MIKEIKEIMANELPTESKGVTVLFGEFGNKDYIYTYIGTIIYAESGIQNLFIMENKFWGKMLFINNNLQFTERDELIYHEMIVHVPLFSHRLPENILIIGGGDGGTVREVVKHKCVKNVDMVEIDEEVVKAAKEYLPALSCELDNPKLNLYFEDGIKFIKKKSTFMISS